MQEISTATSGDPAKPERRIAPEEARLASFVSPRALAQSLWTHRELLARLAARRVARRYRGASLGFLWALLVPLAQLLAYTLVFSLVLRVRWGPEQGAADYALTVFAGMIPYAVFSEAVSQAGECVPEHRGHIKNLLFPTEILPLVPLGAALVDGVLWSLVLLAGVWIMAGGVPQTALFLPLLLVPLLLMAAGVSYLTATAGAFFRDTGPFLRIALHLLLFLTPIFYPPDLVPRPLSWLLSLNPLAWIVEYFRQTLVFGHTPGILSITAALAAGLALLTLGHAAFLSRRQAMADAV